MVAATPTQTVVQEEADQERGDDDACAARLDLGVNAQLLVTHLLTTYHPILPPNPRMIIRVASSWAMLRAVARSLNLEVDAEPANELLVRAAVMWVRFPVLVDEILGADVPPTTDPLDASCTPRWRRRDVQQVLIMNDKSKLDIEQFALFYGKYFAPPVAAADAARPEPLEVVLRDARSRRAGEVPGRIGSAQENG